MKLNMHNLRFSRRSVYKSLVWAGTLSLALSATAVCVACAAGGAGGAEPLTAAAPLLLPLVELPNNTSAAGQSHTFGP